MKLLVFAHSGEAHEFIKNTPSLKSHAHGEGRLHVGDDLAVLMTGEGMDRVFLHLGQALARLASVEKVYNFGLAASLIPECSLGQIISVRTVYRSLFERMEFKSYSSCDDLAVFDCISSFDRILDPKEAKKLSHFGHLVDRELWAVAALCHFHHIPFESFKLISDYGDQAISCEALKSKAQEYSCRLYEKFQQTLKHQNSPHPFSKPLDHREFLSKFYWTQSLRRQFEALYKRWEIANGPGSALPAIDEEENQKLSPKKKTIRFLKKMKESLSPTNSAVRKDIEAIIDSHPSTSKKFHIHYDNHLESKNLKVTMDISSQKDLDRGKQFLDTLPLKKIQSKIEGKNV
ncbi:MAG: hypothetical protein OXB88_00995 [Bacteriovoracales bacterium]|nr:hypothetical protein [Bacteriovoracales bacterium]